MDSFEINKILGAVLFTLLVVLALSIVSEAIYEPHEAEKPGYAIAAVTPEGGGGEAAGGGTEAAAAETPIAVLLQTADPERGAQAAKICQSCHTFDKGGPKRVGPNLWGIVGAPMGHVADFNYSDSMKTMHEEQKVWTFENLNEWLKSPKSFLPGTAMGFAGLKRDQQRADVIDYLRTLSDNPLPLPQPPAAANEVKPATEAGSAATAQPGEATAGAMAPNSGGAMMPGQPAMAPEQPAMAPEQPAMQPTAPAAPESGAMMPAAPAN